MSSISPFLPFPTTIKKTPAASLTFNLWKPEQETNVQKGNTMLQNIVFELQKEKWREISSDRLWTVYGSPSPIPTLT